MKNSKCRKDVLKRKEAAVKAGNAKKETCRRNNNNGVKRTSLKGMKGISCFARSREDHA